MIVEIISMARIRMMVTIMGKEEPENNNSSNIAEDTGATKNRNRDSLKAQLCERNHLV